MRRVRIVVRGLLSTSHRTHQRRVFTPVGSVCRCFSSASHAVPSPFTAQSSSTSSSSSSNSPSPPSPAACPAAYPSPFLSSTALRRLVLFRHAESLGNTGEQNAQLFGDHRLSLSPLGFQQAHALGASLTRAFFLPPPSKPHAPSTAPPLIYLSPYTRTRQTLRAMLDGAGVSLSEVDAREDPRLREVEFGYDVDRPHDVPIAVQEGMRSTHGWLWYRFRGGESPADAYDRMSSWLSSLHRQLMRSPTDTVLVLSHGLTLRCLLMRFLRLSVEAFDSLENPAHCERIDVEKAGVGDDVGRRLLRGARSGWSLSGARVREDWKDWREQEWSQAAAGNAIAPPRSDCSQAGRGLS